MTDTVFHPPRQPAHMVVDMNPRTRRLIVSGLLGALVLLVVVVAVWNAAH